MITTVDYTAINNYWKDDFYFSEDKIVSSIASFFDSKHDLMFCGAMNFSYKRNFDKQNKCIGNRISVQYMDLTNLLNKYYGISINRIDKSDTEYSPEDIYNLCMKKVNQGIPIVVGLDNLLSIWEVNSGEEDIDILPFLMVGINEDESINLVNFHELGIITISKEVFLQSYRWYSSFSKENISEHINLREALEIMCTIQKLDSPVTNGCNEIFSQFPNISKKEIVYTYSSQHDWYKEMLELANDVLDMELETEVQGRKSVLFVPFYFDLLVLYRSRLVFTKALTYLNNYFNFTLFNEIINKAIVSSSKWNYIRMLFSNSYHNNNLDMNTKIVMSKLIKEIAEYEYEINKELEELKDNYCSKYFKSPFYMVHLSNYYNHSLFSNSTASNDFRIIHNKYFYEGDLPFGTIYNFEDVHFRFPTINKNGDSIVCIGQRLKIDKDLYSSITFVGSALYNEMVYDYIIINYEDGTRERLCLGFNGWNYNEYDIDNSPKKIVWKGKVLKRNTQNDSKKISVAKIYSKKYRLSNKSMITSITLPINSFLNIIAITLDR